LVADLRAYDTTGDVTQGKLGAVVVTVVQPSSTDLEGDNSNDPITPLAIGTVEVAKTVNIVPALVTVSIVDEFNEGDKTAIIKFNIDKGSNDIDNDDINVVSIAFETGDAAYLDNAAIRNDEGTPMANTDDNTVMTITADNEISDEDEFTLTANSTVPSVQVVITKEGISYTLDINDNGTIDAGETFTIVNDKIIDLGSYKD